MKPGEPVSSWWMDSRFKRSPSNFPFPFRSSICETFRKTSVMPRPWRWQPRMRRSLLTWNAPLFRTRLVRMADEEHRLYLTLSHIIFDGVAIYRVFLPELAALYKAYSAGETLSPVRTGDSVSRLCGVGAQNVYARDFGEETWSFGAKN